MIIDIIVILKCYLIFLFNTWVSVFGTHVRIRTVSVGHPIYISLDQLYIIDEPIR